MKLFAEHRHFWTQPRKRSLYLGLLFLAVALVVQVNVGRYSARSVTSFVGDLFLDNLPTVDLDFVIVEGALIMVLLGGLLFIFKPRYLLFGLKAVSLFIIVRSFFVSLTHIGIYPRQLVFDEGIGSTLYYFLDFQGNFFFSGHTALPFLMALILWREQFWRWFFLAVSALFGLSVLLAHVHYSIDVFAAPFMSYGVFKIAQYLFSEDYGIITSEG